MAKTTFTATSPFTGTVFTRQSTRAYTHASVAIVRAETLAARALKDAAQEEDSAARSTEIAMHLRAGTTPTAGSPLLERSQSMSENMRRAGVRTQWDAVLYSLTVTYNFPGWVARTRETLATDYEGYAAQSTARAAALRAAAAAILANNTVREGVSFHHSAALAAKAIAADTNNFYDESHVVIAFALPPKAAKAVKSLTTEIK